MKKLDNEFYIAYSMNPIEFYGSAIGINNLAALFNRSRANMIKSLKNKYIRYNNINYFVISGSDLQKGI